MARKRYAATRRLVIDVGVLAHGIVLLIALIAASGLALTCIASPYLGVHLAYGEGGGARASSYLVGILVFTIASVVRARAGPGHIDDASVQAVRRVAALLWVIAAVPPLTETTLLRVVVPWGESWAVIGSWMLLVIAAGVTTSAADAWRSIAQRACASAVLLLVGFAGLAFASQQTALLTGWLCAGLLAVLAYAARQLEGCGPKRSTWCRVGVGKAQPQSVSTKTGKAKTDAMKNAISGKA